MAILLISGALKYILLGAGLIVLWYILAPLFTPTALKKERKNWAEDAEVIEGEGRVVDE